MSGWRAKRKRRRWFGRERNEGKEGGRKGGIYEVVDMKGGDTEAEMEAKLGENGGKGSFGAEGNST